MVGGACASGMEDHSAVVAAGGRGSVVGGRGGKKPVARAGECRTNPGNMTWRGGRWPERRPAWRDPIKTWRGPGVATAAPPAPISQIGRCAQPATARGRPGPPASEYGQVALVAEAGGPPRRFGRPATPPAAAATYHVA
jgi:hypothetical protein